MQTKYIINIFGGPGVGKSTIAAGLFYKMKCKHLDVEIVFEYAKKLTYEKRFDILTSDQLTILAKQHRDISTIYNQRQFVVVDSPLLLSQIYFNPQTNPIDSDLFIPLVIQLFNSYNNINFYIKRNDNLPFENKGRLQDLDQAKNIDDKVKNFLDNNNIECSYVLAGESAVELIYNYLITNNIINLSGKINEKI